LTPTAGDPLHEEADRLSVAGADKESDDEDIHNISRRPRPRDGLELA